MVRDVGDLFHDKRTVVQQLEEEVVDTGSSSLVCDQDRRCLTRAARERDKGVHQWRNQLIQPWSQSDRLHSTQLTKPQTDAALHPNVAQHTHGRTHDVCTHDEVHW